MERKRLALVIAALILIGTMSAAAVYMVISNYLEHDVDVETPPAIELVSISAPSTMYKGSYYDFIFSLSVVRGNWTCTLSAQVTNPSVNFDIYRGNISMHHNLSGFQVSSSFTDETHHIRYMPIGNFTEGTQIVITLSVKIDLPMPDGSYHLSIFIRGEEI